MKLKTDVGKEADLSHPGASLSTFLYPLEPIGLGTAECESIFSYLARLAFAHRISIARLSALLNDLVGWKNRNTFFKTSRNVIRDDKDFLIQALIKATGRPELTRCSLGSLSRLVHFRKSLRFNAARHCPVCVSENSFPDSWNRLMWEIQLVEACPRHHVLLVDGVCGHKREEWVGRPMQVLLPGVCRQCGTLAFGCSSGDLGSATPAQQWTTLQIGKLVAADSGGEEFTRGAFFCGLKAAIEIGWPSEAAAERALGLPSSTFASIWRCRTRIDFRVLLKLCSYIRAQPLSILRGIVIVENADIQPLEIVVPRKRAPKSREEIEQAMTSIRATTPDIPFSALSNTLGVSRTRFTRLFPDLAREMQEQQKRQIKKRRFRRLLAFGRTLRHLKAQVDAEGHIFSKTRVGRATGAVLVKGCLQERLYRWIRERPTHCAR